MRVGLGVGLGVGIPLVAALAGVGVLFGRERRWNRESRGRGDGGFVGGGGGGKEGVGKEVRYGGLAGYDRGGVWHEMPGGQGLGEMEGTVGNWGKRGAGRGGS